MVGGGAGGKEAVTKEPACGSGGDGTMRSGHAGDGGKPRRSARASRSVGEDAAGAGSGGG